MVHARCALGWGGASKHVKMEFKTRIFLGFFGGVSPYPVVGVAAVRRGWHDRAGVHPTPGEEIGVQHRAGVRVSARVLPDDLPAPARGLQAGKDPTAQSQSQHSHSHITAQPQSQHSRAVAQSQLSHITVTSQAQCLDSHLQVAVDPRCQRSGGGLHPVQPGHGATSADGLECLAAGSRVVLPLSVPRHRPDVVDRARYQIAGMHWHPTTVGAESVLRRAVVRRAWGGRELKRAPGPEKRSQMS